MSTLWINIISVICLVYLAVLLIAAVCRFFAKDRSERYAFLKGFKQGSCFLVYFASIPLYAVAIAYSGGSAGKAIFTAIESSIKLIVLAFDYGTVSALADVNTLFASAVYFCFVMVILNAVLFAFSLIGFKLLNLFYRRSAFSQKESIYIIVGFNDKNELIINSITESGGRAVLFVEEDKAQDKDALRSFGYLNKAGCKVFAIKNFCALTEKYAAKHLQNKAVNIIINTLDEKQNLLLTGELLKFIQPHKEIKHDIFNRKGLNGYVFCEPDDISAFSYYVEQTHGAIQYINKYRLVAMDFIDRYPLTRFMTDETDEKYPALKEDRKINMVMIGFGKLCRQLFHTSVSTQQFVTVKDGKISDKQVHYHIYDKTNSNADLILNHNYHRYGRFIEENKDRQSEFLAFPAPPADTHFNKLDICEKEFYNNLSSVVKGNAYSYIVISFGTDMQNLDLGYKLVAKISEWGAADKTKIFVKVRDSKISDSFCGNGMIFFGDEKSVVYNIRCILHEDVENMAKLRSFLYAEEKVKDSKAAAEVAAEKWYQKDTQCKRESNIYACLALRSKLNLLGFDLAKKDSALSDEEESFYKAYFNGSEIPVGKVRADGRMDIVYNNKDFDKLSVRKIYAYLEHQRWNANYISWGYVPASKKDIADNKKSGGEYLNGKDAATRRHGCLTTFDGLKEYREIVSKKQGMDEDKADVIRYDFQIMDDLLWLLNGCGYMVVKKADAC